MDYKTIFPFAYLILPFKIIDEEGIKLLRDYRKPFSAICKVDGDSINLDRLEGKAWGPGIVYANKESEPMCREDQVFPHYKHIFKTFACENNEKDDSEDIFVLSLRKYGKNTFFDRTLLFASPYGKEIEFTFHNHPNSFDAVKMVVNLNSQVGLIILPIATHLTISEFQQLIYFIRKTSAKAIRIKGVKEHRWSILDVIVNWMSEFEGHFQIISDEAKHLSYISADNCSTEIDELRHAVFQMLRSNDIEKSSEMQNVHFVEMPNKLMLFSTEEGSVVLKIRDNNRPVDSRFAYYYRREQSERYVLFVSVILQRYALLNMIDQLTTFGEQINKKASQQVQIKSPKDLIFHPFETISLIVRRTNKIIGSIANGIRRWWIGQPKDKNLLEILREHVKSVSLVRIENYFSQVSEYSIYNDYYQICSKSFGINYLYEEIEQKMSMLNTYLTQQSDEKHERAEWQLSIILAILTVTSATNDIVQLANVGDKIQQPWLFIISISFAIGIFIFIFRAIFKNMR